jgi:hypothetical protein
MSSFCSDSIHWWWHRHMCTHNRARERQAKIILSLKQSLTKMVTLVKFGPFWGHLVHFHISYRNTASRLSFCCGPTRVGVPTEGYPWPSQPKEIRDREIAPWKGHRTQDRNWYRRDRQIVGKGWDRAGERGEDDWIEMSEHQLTLSI